jgi:hypothetical protein
VDEEPEVVVLAEISAITTAVENQFKFGKP